MNVLWGKLPKSPRPNWDLDLSIRDFTCVQLSPCKLQTVWKVTAGIVGMDVLKPAGCPAGSHVLNIPAWLVPLSLNDVYSSRTGEIFHSFTAFFYKVIISHRCKSITAFLRQLEWLPIKNQVEATIKNLIIEAQKASVLSFGLPIALRSYFIIAAP